MTAVQGHVCLPPPRWLFGGPCSCFLAAGAEPGSSPHLSSLGECFRNGDSKIGTALA